MKAAKAFDGVISSLRVRPRWALAAVLVAAFSLVGQLALEGTERLVPGALLAFALAWGSAVDLERLRLPNAITLPLTALGLLLAGLSDLKFSEAMIGCVAGYAAGWLLSEAFWRIRKKEGLGQGDVKLLAAAGAWLGWSSLPFVVLTASLAAMGVVLMLVFAGRMDLKTSPRLPFGPFLAFGIWLSWLTSDHPVI